MFKRDVMLAFLRWKSFILATVHFTKVDKTSKSFKNTIFPSFHTTIAE